MNEINPEHPRYHSLKERAKIAQAYKEGVLADTAMIAHGRGEAFDYLIGEVSTPNSIKAIRTSAAILLLAENPVISVNGNTAVLAARELVELSQKIPARLEINLFYRTPLRVLKVEKILKEAGAEDLLGKENQEFVSIEGLEGPRSRASPEGVHRADVVLVPLEDGDRAQALVNAGKTVITIDLNPLSRTANSASVTIVDNVVRAIPLLIQEVEKLKEMDAKKLREIVDEFDNQKNLHRSLVIISGRLKEI